MAEVAEAIGTPLMPWQAQVADTIGEVDPATGRMAYELAVVTVPRQSGKTTLVRALAMQRLMTRSARVWYTAQTRNDARDAWLDSVDAVTRSPLGPEVKVRLTNGSESLRLTCSGGTYRVFAPLGEALHGRQSDLVVLDEAWAHDLARGRELMQAIIPTMATRARPQTLVLSTAGTDQSQWLKELVTAGRAGTNPRMAYLEWSTDEDISPDDIGGVVAAHPAVGHTITEAAVQAAADVLDGGEFLRAYANVWTGSLEIVISARAWSECRSEEAMPGAAPVAFGFDVTPDRSASTIAAACLLPGGAVLVEVIDHRPGVSWLSDRVAELAARWKPVAVVADSVGPAASIVDRLTARRVDVATTSTREYATACQDLYDRIHEGPALAVRTCPALEDAAAAVGKRTLGEGWAWARRASVPISPLVAATLAVHGITHPPVRKRTGIYVPDR